MSIGSPSYEQKEISFSGMSPTDMRIVICPIFLPGNSTIIPD